MIELKPKIKKALLDIDFVNKYEQISKRFSDERTPSNERLRYFDGEIIIESITQNGYIVKFEPKEKYFKLVEVKVEDYTFSANIILDNGMVDFVWIVKEGGNLILGLPIGEYSRLLISPNYRIKKPIFGTYEDLDEIFESCFIIFEEFKQSLLGGR